MHRPSGPAGTTRPRHPARPSIRSVGHRHLRVPVPLLAAALAVTLAVTPAATGCTGSGAPSPARVPSPSASPSGSADQSQPAAGTPAGQVTVTAADSLAGPLTVLGKEFEAVYPGTKVVINLGVSATQAQQIIAGPAPDVFVAANPAIMKQVTDAGAASGPPTVVARSRLVIAVPPDNPARIGVLADLARPAVKVALCAENVPCGGTARRIFSAAGLSVNPVREVSDGPAAVAMIKSREVDAALVYRPLVKAHTLDVTGIEFGQAADAVDDYPMVTLKAAPNSTGAAAFVGFVTSARGRQAFAEADFELPVS